jgi:hypothetical protein
MAIDDRFPLERKVVAVDGVPFAYVDHGNADPIVLLHGNSDVDLPVAQMCCRPLTVDLERYVSR